MTFVLLCCIIEILRREDTTIPLRRTRTTLPTTAQALAPRLISYETVVQDMEAKHKSSKLQYDARAQGERAQLIVGSWAKPPPNRRGNPWS